MLIDARHFLYDLAFTTHELLWIFGFTAACFLIVLSPLIRYLLRRKR